MIPLLLILIAAISYAIGTLSSPILLAKFVFHKDITRQGRGYVGYNTFVRHFGQKWGLAVIAADIVKSVIAVVIGGLLMLIPGALAGRLAHRTVRDRRFHRRAGAEPVYVAGISVRLFYRHDRHVDLRGSESGEGPGWRSGSVFVPVHSMASPGQHSEAPGKTGTEGFLGEKAGKSFARR